MSVKQSKHHPARSEYEAMNTAELQQIIRQDLFAPGDGGSDPDTMLEIAAILAEREAAEGAAPDVEAAWERLQASRKQTPPEPHAARRRSLRTALVLAACVACLCMLVVSVGAFCYSNGSIGARWNQETFSFAGSGAETVSDASSGSHVPEQLWQLQQNMLSYGINYDVFPSYLPEGYELENVDTLDADGYLIFYCTLTDTDRNIIYLQYRVYDDEGALGGEVFQKDAGAPTLYIANDTKFYLMTNMGKHLATWFTGNLECSISNLNSQEELLHMLDSIGN